MNWLYYLLEANIYLSVFYVLYIMLLANETFYCLNRIYLLIACLAAYIIPFLQIGILRPAEIITLMPAHAINTTVAQPITQQAASVSSILPQLLVYGYLLVSAIMFFLLAFKIIRLMMLTRSNEVTLVEGYKMIILEGSERAFSFFNYIFIGTKISDTGTIVRHEQVHVEQKHSLDIIFLEILKTVSWFNPIVFLLQRSIKTLHEYIADEQTAAQENGALRYSTFLLKNAYGLNGPATANSFFNYKLLKKRIIMLNKKRSGRSAMLKYLVAAPAFAGMICVSTLAFSKTYGWVDLAPAKAVIHRTTTDSVYSVVDKAPEFPGGMHGLSTYVGKNLHYPKSGVVNKIEGRVLVSFIVERDGSVTHVKVAKSVSADLDKEAARVVSSMPNFKPGQNKGKSVRTAYTIPISFKL